MIIQNFLKLLIIVALPFGIFTNFKSIFFKAEFQKQKAIIQILSDLKIILESQQRQIDSLIKLSDFYLPQRVIVTAYHPPSKGINSDINPRNTALMKKPMPGWTLAVSKDLVDAGWLGKKVYIDGWGVGHATDRMSSKIKGKRIDVCFNTLRNAKQFGVKESTAIVMVD